MSFFAKKRKTEVETEVNTKLYTVATCNLNQWALDFPGNLARIEASIREAKAAGARYRCGPELEVSGYGCEDHFFEEDTVLHCWQSLAALLQGELTHGILCDVGMPVVHRNVRYNCRVFLLDSKVVLIRPKLCCCDDGNYRETRWFTEWPRARAVEDFALPGMIRAICGQEACPLGFAAIATADTVVGSETCEELFTPHSPHIPLALDGVEIISNGSGSHHQLRKLDKRLDLMRSASSKAGGVYLYANQRGGDGSRLYYDGCALVACNGDILAQGSQFGLQARNYSARNSARNSRRSALTARPNSLLQDVEVIVATIDLQQVRSARAAVPSRSRQAAIAPAVHRVHVDFILGAPAYGSGGVPVSPTAEIAARLHRAEEEIALGPACWLWDYLRRSGAGGYFLPLSGGADSSSTAAIVGIMCQLVVKAAGAGDEQVIADVRKVTRKAAPWLPADAKELCGMILHTCYMGTENSSAATRGRAEALASELGAHHTLADIGPMVKGVIATFEAITSKSPKFKSQGGTETEDLALQNIQARSRMVLSYTLAQLLPWTRDRPSFLLVLGSANVDEALAGYTMGRVSDLSPHTRSPTLLTSPDPPSTAT